MLGTSVRRRGALAVFALGLLVGGMLTATALVVLGAPVHALLGPGPRWALVGVFAVALGLRAARIVRFAVPQNRRLVPETVFLNGPTWSAMQFGVEMGSGVRTYLTSALPHLLAVAVVCAATPVQGWAAGAGFGAGRALMAWASTRGGDPTTWRAAWLHRGGLVAAVLGSSVTASLVLLALGT